jgi:mxaD protein
MNMSKFLTLTYCTLSLVLAACASGGSISGVKADSLSVEESVTVNASAAIVWDKVNNFGDLGAWHPAVAKTTLTSGGVNELGAVRLLTLQDGGTITETLTAYNAENMYYSYVINKGVLPVSGYASTIQVKPVTANSSEVVWRGNFKRKDLSSHPAKGQDDETASATIHSVYRGGLDNLKKLME